MPAPDEEDDDITTTPPGPITQPTEVPAVIVTAVKTEEPKGGQEEGVQQVKHSDFKRIKQEQRDRGRREALAELETSAKAAGYASHSEAMKDLERLRSLALKPAIVPPPPAAPPTQPKDEPTMSAKTPKNDKQIERDAAEKQRQHDERTKERKAWRVSERKRAEMQTQLDAKDAEMGLREELYRAGVTDTDYALRLLTRELEGKTVEEIDAYDRSKFYAGLRTERPYLFNETVIPANTGTSGIKPDGSAPKTPDPGAATIVVAADGQFDARKAKPQEVQERLRALGLNPHM